MTQFSSKEDSGLVHLWGTFATRPEVLLFEVNACMCAHMWGLVGKRQLPREKKTQRRIVLMRSLSQKTAKEYQVRKLQDGNEKPAGVRL